MVEVHSQLLELVMPWLTLTIKIIVVHFYISKEEQMKYQSRIALGQSNLKFGDIENVMLLVL